MISIFRHLLCVCIFGSRRWRGPFLRTNAQQEAGACVCVYTEVYMCKEIDIHLNICIYISVYIYI